MIPDHYHSGSDKSRRKKIKNLNKSFLNLVQGSVRWLSWRNAVAMRSRDSVGREERRQTQRGHPPAPSYSFPRQSSIQTAPMVYLAFLHIIGCLWFNWWCQLTDAIEPLFCCWILLPLCLACAFYTRYTQIFKELLQKYGYCSDKRHRFRSSSHLPLLTVLNLICSIGSLSIFMRCYKFFPCFYAFRVDLWAIKSSFSAVVV